MSISNNIPLTPFNPSQSSGTQEDGITQVKKQGSDPTEKSNLGNQDHLNKTGAADDESTYNSTSEPRSASNNHPASGVNASINDGGATADGAFKEQQGGANFVHDTVLSRTATDYVSTSIQKNSALSSMTLKSQPIIMQAMVTKTGSTQSSLLNANGAPQLEAPGPILPENDAPPMSDEEDSSDDNTSSPNNHNAAPSGAHTGRTAGPGIRSAAASGIRSAAASGGTIANTVATTAQSAASASDADPLDSTPTEAQDTFNVFDVVAESAELSVNSELDDISAQIAGANAQEYYQQADITKVENNINQANIDAHQHHKGGQTSKIIGWTTASVSVAAGTALVCTGVGSGIGAALIIGGSLSMVMMSSAGPVITASLVKLLVSWGMSNTDASIFAAVIIAVVIMAVAMGGEASGIGEALTDAVEAGSLAAEGGSTAAANSGEALTSVSEASTSAASSGKALTSVSEVSTETSAESAEASANASKAIAGEAALSTADTTTNGSTSSTSAASTEAAGSMSTTVADSVSSAKNFTMAFGRSLASSTRNALGRTAESLSEFASAPVSSSLDAASSAASSVASTLGSIAMTPVRMAEVMASACRGLCAFVESAASTTLEDFTTAVSAAMKEATTFESLPRTAAQLYKMAPDALGAAYVTFSMAQTAVSLYGSYVSYEAAKVGAELANLQGTIEIEQAGYNQMQSFIELTNTSLNNELKAMNQIVENAGQTISMMSSPVTNLVS